MFEEYKLEENIRESVFNGYRIIKDNLVLYFKNNHNVWIDRNRNIIMFSGIMKDTEMIDLLNEIKNFLDKIMVPAIS